MKRTPLTRRTGLVARSPLKRGNTKLGIRRPTLTSADRAARDVVGERSGGWCELRIDGVCLGRATNYQHRRATAHGGPTTVSNGLDVCGMGNVSGCHGFIHQHPTLAVDNGWTVKSGKPWRSRAVVLWHGFFVLGDDGLFYDPPHPRGCAVWTSDNCDCNNALEA